jgi:hypothetical protein
MCKRFGLIQWITRNVPPRPRQAIRRHGQVIRTYKFDEPKIRARSESCERRKNSHYLRRKTVIFLRKSLCFFASFASQVI